MTAALLRLAVIAFISYIFGALSTINIASVFVFKRNLRKLGKGNMAISNFRRIYGEKKAGTLLLIELVKDLIPIIVGGIIIMGSADRFKDVEEGFVMSLGHSFATFCLTYGAVFPVFNRFRGAHGFFPLILGAFFQSIPMGIVVLGSAVLVLWRSKYISLATVVAAVMYAVLAVVLLDYSMSITVCGLTTLLVVIREFTAIIRVLNDKEEKLSLVKDLSWKFDS